MRSGRIVSRVSFKRYRSVLEFRPVTMLQPTPPSLVDLTVIRCNLNLSNNVRANSRSVEENKKDGFSMRMEKRRRQLALSTRFLCLVFFRCRSFQLSGYSGISICRLPGGSVSPNFACKIIHFGTRFQGVKKEEAGTGRSWILTVPGCSQY